MNRVDEWIRIRLGLKVAPEEVEAAIEQSQTQQFRDPPVLAEHRPLIRGSTTLGVSLKGRGFQRPGVPRLGAADGVVVALCAVGGVVLVLEAIPNLAQVEGNRRVGSDCSRIERQPFSGGSEGSAFLGDELFEAFCCRAGGSTNKDAEDVASRKCPVRDPQPAPLLLGQH